MPRNLEINLFDARYTHSEMCLVAEADGKLLYRWEQREIIEYIDQRLSEDRGIRIYPPIDCIRVAAMFAVYDLLDIKPASIFRVADAVAERARQIFPKSGDVKLEQLEPPEPHVLVVTRFGGSSLERIIPASEVGNFISRASLVVPADEIIYRTLWHLRFLWEGDGEFSSIASNARDLHEEETRRAGLRFELSELESAISGRKATKDEAARIDELNRAIQTASNVIERIKELLTLRGITP